MKTRFFKFPDHPTAFQLAAINGLTTIDQNNNPILIGATHDYAIDVVGTIYQPTGVMLTDATSGFSYPEMVAIPGWHVNARIVNGNLPPAFDQYEIFPAQPSRDFA